MTIPEFKTIQNLLTELLRSELKDFPPERGRLDAPTDQGVYIIYDPQGVILHVGRTPRARGGLRQRLKNHLHGNSSFSEHYLKGQGARLRKGCCYRCLVIKDPRQRALLEALAIGTLCPKHIGLGI